MNRPNAGYTAGRQGVRFNPELWRQCNPAGSHQNAALDPRSTPLQWNESLHQSMLTQQPALSPYGQTQHPQTSWTQNPLLTHNDCRESSASDITSYSVGASYQQTANPHETPSAAVTLSSPAAETSLPVEFPYDNTVNYCISASGYIEPSATSSSSLNNTSSYPSYSEDKSRTSFNSSHYFPSGQPHARQPRHEQDNFVSASVRPGVGDSQQSLQVPTKEVGRRRMCPSESGELQRRQGNPKRKKPAVHNYGAQQQNPSEHRSDLLPSTDRKPSDLCSRHSSVSSRSSIGRRRLEYQNQSQRPAPVGASQPLAPNHFVNQYCDLWINQNAAEGHPESTPNDDDLARIAQGARTENTEYILQYIMDRVSPRQAGHSLPSDLLTFGQTSNNHSLERVNIAKEYLEDCKRKNCADGKGANVAGQQDQSWNSERRFQCLRVHNGVRCPRSFRHKDSWLKHLKITEPQTISVCTINNCKKPISSHFYEHYRIHCNAGEIDEAEIPFYKENDVVITKPPFRRKCRVCRRSFDDWDLFHNDVFQHFDQGHMTMQQWYDELDPSDSGESDVERKEPPHDQHRDDYRRHDDDSDDEGDGDDGHTPTRRNFTGIKGQRYSNGNARNSRTRRSRNSDNQSTSYGGGRFYNNRSQTWSAGCSYEDRPRSQHSSRRLPRSSSRRRSRSLDSHDRLALLDFNLLAIGAGVTEAKLQDNNDKPGDSTAVISDTTTISDSGYGSEVEAHFDTWGKAAQSGQAPTVASCKCLSAIKTDMKCPFLSQLLLHCISGPWGKRPPGPRAFIIIAGEILLAPHAEDVAKRRRIWVAWSSIWPDVKWPKSYGDFVFLAPAEHRQLRKHEQMTLRYRDPVTQSWGR